MKSTTVGDFFFDEISTSIVIPAGARFGYFEVATINDDVVEDDGSITVASALRNGLCCRVDTFFCCGSAR